MSYKIAIASTDGISVDRSFRNAKEFLIIEVDDDGRYEVAEIRQSADEQISEEETQFSPSLQQDCGGAGCGRRNGCGGSGSPKFLLVEDCRCLLCTQIGFKIQKQLERKAIGAFEVGCRIDEALEKIINYYDRVDRHQSLRGIAKEQSK